MQTLILSALFAGLVAIAVTVAIERWGGVVGGILGTLPTTIVPASIGMYLTGGLADLETSLALVPVWMLLNGLFVGAWVVWPRIRGAPSLPEMTAVALGAWLVLAATLSWLLADHAKFSVGLLGLLVMVGLGLAMTWNAPPAPKGTNPVSARVLLLRGTAAATAIGIAVHLSGLGMPLLAGLASVFPAIFLTTMVALWLAQGPQVGAGAAGPMMLGGSSVGAYALLAPICIGGYGIVLGTLICWFGAVACTSLPAWAWTRWRHNQA